jgi:hypothetical protein
MQRGGDVLVKFASLNITTNASKVTVKSGKFRHTMPVAEWSAMVSQSMASPIPLNPKPKSHSSQVHLAYGLGFRLKPGEGMSECFMLIQSPKPQPVMQIQPTPNSHSLQGLQSIRFDHVLQSFEQQILNKEGDENGIITQAGQEAYTIATRFVQRNILDHKISRYVPQDVKIAVAIRDQGRCTDIDSFGRRCTATTNLQYDHRFIPFSFGGTQRIWNLTLYCGPHNLEKSNEINWTKSLIEFLGGMLP